MSGPDVDVVIVAFRSEATIAACVDSVRDDPLVHEVVVVDNDSPDAGGDAARAAGARVLHQPNRGFGAGCNAGAAATTAPFVLFLNPDAVVRPGTLAGLRAHLQSHPRAALVASELRLPDGRPEPVARRRPSVLRAALEPGPAARLDQRSYSRRAPDGGPVAWLSGACFLARRTAFEEVKGFDESFFLYGEDGDLGLRLVAAGWTNDWIPGFITDHRGGASTATAGDRGKASWAEGWARMTRRHHDHPALVTASMRAGLVGRVVLWSALQRPERAAPWRAALAATRTEPLTGSERIRLLDVPIDVVSLDEATDRVAGLVDAERFATVATVNLDFLSQAGRDPLLARTLAEADLVVADGVPLLWMARWQRTPLPGRVNGTDLAECLLRRAGELGWRVYFLGGEPGVAERAALAAAERYGVVSAGTAGPPPGEMQDPGASTAIARAVSDGRADLLLLAIGGGHQERWIRSHRADLGSTVCIGVGSALDFIAGSRARAPRWMQERGLEWAWRLAGEPRRLWRRYLVDGPIVLARFAAQQLRSAVR